MGSFVYFLFFFELPSLSPLCYCLFDEDFAVSSSSVLLLCQFLTPSFGILSRQVFVFVERTFLHFSNFILWVKTSAASCSVYASQRDEGLHFPDTQMLFLLELPDDFPIPRDHFVFVWEPRKACSNSNLL